MPFAISSGDRKLLISAAVMLVILIVVASVFVPQNPASVSYPSSYSAASDGAKATFLLLQEMGYNVERWEDSPTALPKDPRGMVLILADPFGGATPEERHALNRFLLDGGRVLVTGHGARLLPDNDSSYNSGLKDYSWQNFPAVLPSPITRGAREITLLPWTKWGTRYPGQVALYGNQSGSPVAVMYAVGKGQVIWVSASIPLMNVSSTELNAPAVPAVATAASPSEPATIAVPAKVTKRCEANIATPVMSKRSEVVSGSTSESDSGLEGSLKHSWWRGLTAQPYLSHQLCRSSRFWPRESPISRSAFFVHTTSGMLL